MHQHFWHEEVEPIVVEPIQVHESLPAPNPVVVIAPIVTPTLETNTQITNILPIDIVPPVVTPTPIIDRKKPVPEIHLQLTETEKAGIETRTDPITGSIGIVQPDPVVNPILTNGGQLVPTVVFIPQNGITYGNNGGNQAPLAKFSLGGLLKGAAGIGLGAITGGLGGAVVAGLGAIGLGGGGGGSNIPGGGAGSPFPGMGISLGPGGSMNIVPNPPAGLTDSRFGGPVTGTFTDLDANEVVNKDGFPIVTNPGAETRIRCARGYVAITHPISRVKMCMLRGVAMRMGLWSPAKKPPISAKDWKALSTAEATSKKLINVAKKAINVSDLKKPRPKAKTEIKYIPVRTGPDITNIDNS